jgi:hypothetical protein
MFRTTIDNVAQKRTLRPLYAQHQATPYGGFLSTSWTKAVDIYPGMVMAKLSGENFTLAGTASGGGVLPATNTAVRAFGLSALFVAPDLKIDETQLSGLNVFSVWFGGPDAVFEILAPAFAESSTWSNPTDGSVVMLGVTNASHTDGPGKLSPFESNVVELPIARLIEYRTTSIVVQLHDGPVYLADQTP